jgi:hypothetical protein
MLRLGIENGVDARLATLTSEFLLYFAEVNRIHDNDVIRTVFAQKCWRDDPKAVAFLPKAVAFLTTLGA